MDRYCVGAAEIRIVARGDTTDREIADSYGVAKQEATRPE
jgi:hypothetical protein